MPLNWLRPIDSEHSAIWQCLAGERRSDVARLILTASGGPFREWSAERLKRPTPGRRTRPSHVAHGTQDHHRLGDAHEQGAGGHRGTLAVRCRGRSDRRRRPPAEHRPLAGRVRGRFIKAQLGLPDMRIPIQYALTYPITCRRPRRDLPAPGLPTLSFEPVDDARFPALAIGREAGRRGPRASAALIAADDVAVDRFLDGSLSFNGDRRAVCRRRGRASAADRPQTQISTSCSSWMREVRAWAATAAARQASRSRKCLISSAWATA